MWYATYFSMTVIAFAFSQTAVYANGKWLFFCAPYKRRHDYDSYSENEDNIDKNASSASDLEGGG